MNSIDETQYLVFPNRDMIERIAVALGKIAFAGEAEKATRIILDAGALLTRAARDLSPVWEALETYYAGACTEEALKGVVEKWQKKRWGSKQ